MAEAGIWSQYIMIICSHFLYLFLCNTFLLIFVQPNDIRAAEYGGALAIGVCTGIFSQQELRDVSQSETPAIILDNLLNTKCFLSILGLPARDF